MHRIILPSVACLTVAQFSTYSRKHGKKVIEDEIRVLIFPANLI
jgi:hypothetical protein